MNINERFLTILEKFYFVSFSRQKEKTNLFSRLQITFIDVHLLHWSLKTLFTMK